MMMHTKTLGIGTVFKEDSPIQRKWADLQSRFIRASEKDAEYVIAYHGEKSSYFEEIADHTLKPDNDSSNKHASGLRELKKYFLESKHEHFLFLDSDAFPIRRDWVNLVTKAMSPKHEIASAIRYENLENRIHVCLLYVKSRKYLKNLVFKQRDIGSDLIGSIESDLSVGEYDHSMRAKVFPLLRSNRINLHPMLCAIYYNAFYHHGCGSRKFCVRSKRYWDKIITCKNDPHFFSDNKLFQDPNKFIQTLGWKEFDYIEI